MIRALNPQVIRGPHPEVMSDLCPYKVQTILNLQTGAQEILSMEIYSESERADRLGIQVIHEKLSNFFPPSELQIRRCLNVMQGLARYSGQPRRGLLPVYVHCKHGKDRTGFICAAYRVLVEGWEVDAAIREMLRLGFHKWWYWWWIPAFRRRMARMVAGNRVTL